MTTTPLPEAVRELALRLGAEACKGSVLLLQSGRMRQDGRSGWRDFRATQSISLEHCEFEWHARLAPLGMVRVLDALVGNHGRLEAKALGIVPLVQVAPARELTRGELMRYLAELPWAPDAILSNPNLRWRVEDDRHFAVSASLGGIDAEVTLELDREGRISGIFAPDRPRTVGKTFVPMPWKGRFHDYGHREGRLIPLGATVSWLSEAGEEVCFEARIEGWTVDEDAAVTRS